MAVRHTTIRKIEACAFSAVLFLATCRLDDQGSGDPEVAAQARALTTPPTVAEPALLDPEVAGALPGGGAVSSGQYVYTLPIDVPKGRAGMQPQVSLSYGSSGGEGPLGVGWTLTGVTSFITRCPRVVASGKQADFVRFDATDRFCLDGAPLVLVSGTHGAVNATYRTEIDTFTKVVIKDLEGTEPRNFTVYFKDGRKANFLRRSTLPVREVLNADGTVQSTQTVTFNWPMNVVEDRAGNTMKIYFTESSATPTASLPMPDYIEYTTCKSAGTCAYPSERKRKVDFVYTTEGRATESYMNGVLVKSTKRLAKIFTAVMNPGNTTWTTGRVYKLRYDTSVSTGRSLLVGVKMCEATETICMPETTFAWRTGSPPRTYVTTPIANATKFNLVQLPTGTKRPQMAPENAFALYDANGDGNDDVVLKSWATSTVDMSNNNQAPVDQVLLSNGHDYFGAPQNIDPDGDGLVKNGCTGSEVMDFSRAQAVDMDGDGKKELVAMLNAGCPFLDLGPLAGWSRVQPGGVVVNGGVGGPRVYGVLTWDKSTAKLKRAAPTLGDINFLTQGWDRDTVLFAEMNGDGLPELMRIQAGVGTVDVLQGVPNPNAVPSVLHHGMATFAIAPCSNPGCIPVNEHRPPAFEVGDENSDGRAEVLFTNHLGTRRSFAFSPDVGQGGAGQLWYQSRVVKAPESTAVQAIPTPTGGGVTPPWGTADFSNTLDPVAVNWYPVDINGDGLKDALYVTNINTPQETWKLRINTGAGYKPPVDPGPVLSTLLTYPSNTKVSNGVLFKRVDNGLRVADMNGDGREDLVLLDPLPKLIGPTSHASGYNVATSTNPKVAFSNGTGFDAPLNIGTAMDLLYIRQEVFHTQIGDINGDGLPDLVDMVAVPGEPGKRALVVRRPQVKPEVILSVSDERGLAETITYDTMSSGSLARGVGTSAEGDTHVPDSIGVSLISPVAACAYPARCLSTGTIVRAHENLRGARQMRILYRYFGGRADAEGRGWIGFARTKVRDLVTGFETTADVDQSRFIVESASSYYYPWLSEAKTVRTQYIDTLGTLGAADLTHLQAPDAWPLTVATTRLDFTGFPVRLLFRQHVQETYEIAETPAQLRHKYDQTTNYDDFGNATVDISETKGDGAASRTIKVESAEYDNLTDDWLIGLPRSVTTTTRTFQDAYGTGCNSTVCAEETQRTEYEYDAKGLLSKTHREKGAANDTAVTTELTRDASGIVTAIKTIPYVASGTPPNSRTSTLTYDESGVNVKQSTNPLGHKNWFMYYAYGDGDWMYGAADQNGAATQVDSLIVRDKLGRTRDVTDDEGGSTSTNYGLGVTRYIMNSVKSATFYDTRGRPTLETWTTFDGKSAVRELSYNALGEIIKSRYIGSSLSHASLSASETSARGAFGGPTGGFQTSATTFNRLGRPKTATKGTSETTTFGYPAPIGKRTFTDASGDYAETFADQTGRTRSLLQREQTSPQRDIVTTYGYESRGLLGHVRTADNAREVMKYDKIGRLVERRQYTTAGDHNILNRRLTYTSFDEVATAHHGGEGNGVVSVSYVRDDLGRVTERKDANAAAAVAERQVFAWDPSNAIGKPWTASTYVGTLQTQLTTLQYDALGRFKSVRENFVGTTENLSMVADYDSRGRLGAVAYPETPANGDTFGHAVTGGLKVNFSYSGNLVEYVRDAAKPPTNPPIWQAQERDLFGSIKRATDADGGSATWTRDPNTSRLSAHDVVRRSITNPQSFEYYPNGLLKKRIRDGVPEEFFYDGLHRLKGYERNKDLPSANTHVKAYFGYDAVGNITGVTMTASNAPDWPRADEVYAYTNNRIPNFQTALNVGGVNTAFIPDDVGRILRHERGAQVLREYSYNTTDLPTRVVEGGKTVDFKYNGLGDRVRKKTTNPDGSVVDVFYVAGLYEQHRMTGIDGVVTGKSVFRIPGEDGTLAEVTQPWTTTQAGTRATTFVDNDNQGSPVFRITDGVRSTGGYYPFGKPQGARSTTTGYTGHLQDDDLGLINMNGRIYDVAQRRFISRDPVASGALHAGGRNPYSYALNDPINRFDPSGFADCAELGGCWTTGVHLANTPAETGGGNSGFVALLGVVGAIVVTAVVGLVLSPGLRNAARSFFNDPLGSLGIGGGGGGRGRRPPPPTGSPFCADNPGCVASRAAARAAADAAASRGSGSRGGSSSAGASTGESGGGTKPAKEANVLRRLTPGVITRGATVLTDKQAQAWLEQIYNSSGLDWGQPPVYDPYLGEDAITNPQTGVRIGPAAFGSGARLLSTLLHENVHVYQLRGGRWAEPGDESGPSMAEVVNELEAYMNDVRHFEERGLSKYEKGLVWQNVLKYMDLLDQNNDRARGTLYMKRIFMDGNFRLLQGDIDHTPAAGQPAGDWIWPDK